MLLPRCIAIIACDSAYQPLAPTGQCCQVAFNYLNSVNLFQRGPCDSLRIGDPPNTGVATDESCNALHPRVSSACGDFHWANSSVGKMSQLTLSLHSLIEVRNS